MGICSNLAKNTLMIITQNESIENVMANMVRLSACARFYKYELSINVDDLNSADINVFGSHRLRLTDSL